jgi:hypothetical protein
MAVLEAPAAEVQYLQVLRQADLGILQVFLQAKVITAVQVALRHLTMVVGAVAEQVQ